jgi:hypothetical protein
MKRRPEPPDQRVLVVDDLTEQALHDLLRIPAPAAARIRETTGHRRRPRGQSGPSADYGRER